jgi:tripartite-type tricarboxylate transporter receptor subunit TctC
VVIENRPGGGGNIGIETVAKSAPDGYTLLVCAPSLTISPSLYSKLGYDPLKDFAPVTLLAEVPNVITIRQSLPANNLKEFIDYGRANPGKLNFGTSGLGTATHLASVLFLGQTGIKGVNVVYKGSSQALVAMIGNEVDLVVIGPPAALPHIQAGRVKALAVMRATRLASMPQVPTTREAGVANTEVITWYGLLAPAGTPRAIVNRLHDIWAKAAATPELREKMQSSGSEVITTTPEQFSAMIRAEVPQWRKVITEANLKLE